MNLYPYYKVFCIFASCFLIETKHIAQFLLSNHHLTTRIIEQANTTLKLRMSVDFTIVVLGACGEPDRRYGGSALSPCPRVCATRII